MNGFTSLLVLAPALSLALSGCSHLSPTERAQARLEDLDLYLQNAGEPVKSFSYVGNIEEWHELENDRIVVRTSFNDAYMLKVFGPCHELSGALTVGLSSRGGFVGVGDNVIAGGERCPITEIRPINYKAVREAKKAAAEERRAAAKTEEQR